MRCSLEDSTKDENEKNEQLHFMQVLNAFKGYRKTALHRLNFREDNYENLLPEHKAMLPNHKKMLDETRLCIDCNAVVIREITQFCGDMFQNVKYKELQEHVSFTSFDSDKVKSTLKQIVRDWSCDGAEERSLSYQPLIDEIVKFLPVDGSSETPSVLVPGCGLGRLAWELARLGYFSQGNEFSFYMLFISNFIINKTPGDTESSDHHKFSIYPWIDKSCNNMSWDDALKAVQFPDVNPATLPYSNRFSMTAGDFLEVYTEQNSWDCVATCYFIDTAHNIISYIERIFKILKPGGLWVNLGPLLYHFSGMAKEASIELSWEEVVEVIKKVGFTITKQDWMKGLYTSNPQSLLQYQYNCALLVATKPG